MSSLMHQEPLGGGNVGLAQQLLLVLTPPPVAPPPQVRVDG